MIPIEKAWLVGIFVGLTAGCASPDEEPVVETEAAIRSAEAREVTVRLDAEPRDTAVPGSCARSGRWTVDLVDARLRGDACVEARMRRVDRALTEEELSSFRLALESVHPAARAASCARNQATASLAVTWGNTRYTYVTRQASCSSTAIPVFARGIDRVVDLMFDLTTTETGANAG